MSAPRVTSRARSSGARQRAPNGEELRRSSEAPPTAQADTSAESEDERSSSSRTGGGVPVSMLYMFFPFVAVYYVFVYGIGYIFCPTHSNLWNSPANLLCFFIETQMTAMYEEITMATTITASLEYRFAKLLLSYMGDRVEAAAENAVLNQSWRNWQQRTPHVQLVMDPEIDGENEPDEHNEEPPNSSNSSSDNLTDQGQGMRESVSSQFNQLRATINQNREAQTLCTLFTAVLPFIFLFLAKAVYDNILNLSQFSFAILSFMYIDSRVQALVSTGRPSRSERLLDIGACCVVTFIGYELVSVIKNFDLIQSITFRYMGKANHCWIYTVFLVVITDSTVKMFTCFVKIMIVCVRPSIISNNRKRRVYQVIEYFSQVYRCLLPIPHWMAWFLGKPETDEYHFFGMCLLSAYGVLKIREVFYLGLIFVRSLHQLVQISHYGSTPSKEELEKEEICSICHDRLIYATKLPCTHIFCLPCIEQWLDKEHTCPMCRAVVEKKDNSYKSGATSRNIRFY